MPGLASRLALALYILVLALPCTRAILTTLGTPLLHAAVPAIRSSRVAMLDRLAMGLRIEPFTQQGRTLQTLGYRY